MNLTYRLSKRYPLKGSYVLNVFSEVITKIEPEKQKDLLHSIISKITVNAGDHPAKGSIKNIE